MTTPPHSRSLRRELVLVIGLFGGACGREQTDGDGGGGETGSFGLEPCDCPQGIASFDCECFVLGEWDHFRYFCGDAMAVESACEEQCWGYHPLGSFSGEAHEIACAGGGSPRSCTDWVPESNVEYDPRTDTYILDWAFVSELFDDPEPLSGCDDASILLGEDGFVVHGADRGELLYELGLRDGDVLMGINDVDLNSYEDAAFAFSYLWLTNREDAYTVLVERNAAPFRLQYHLENRP